MSRSRARGVALLLVLGTLVLVTGTLALATLAAAQGTRAAAITRSEGQAMDLLRSAEPLILDWLARSAPSAVVHPDLAEPAVQVLDLMWDETSGDRTKTHTLRAAAYDLQGMVPRGTSQASPLWLAVPTQWRKLAYRDASTLLDLVGKTSPVYPRIGSGESAIGSLVAVLPASDRRGAPSPTAPTININTAPKPLLEATLRLAQRGDLSSILAARAEGRPAQAPSRQHSDRRGDDTLVQLTGRSTLWAVRVDASVNGLTRSWWTLYRSRRGQWEIIERHAIPE